MKKDLNLKAIFFLLSFCISINMWSQNLLVESLSGPITQNEINAFKANMKSLAKTPLPVDNTGNLLVYGTTAMNTRGMGIMYEITADTAFLNRMILFSDYILACRNDNVNGKKLILITGNVDPAWPNYDDNPAPANNQGWLIGGGQGGTVEYFAYCAELILKHPNLYNVTVPIGDKFGYGTTYLQRAKKYVDEANVTFDKVIYPHNVNPTTNLLVWWDKTNILPWNQQMMATGGIFRIARCLEILGTDPTRLALYNKIISYNCSRFLSHLNANKYTQNGKDYFKWTYVEENPLKHIEDNTEHSTYDVYGMNRNYQSGRYGVTKDVMVNFGNTMKDIIMLADGTFAMNVDGGSSSGAPRGALRPDWIVVSGFRTDVYSPYAKSLMTNNDTRPGNIRAASEILWVKYMNFNKLWNNFEYKALNIPGKIEAEHYDLGGEGVSYHDLTTGNSLNAFRMDNVDVQATTDVGGGYNIGAVQVGEWMNYTVNVTKEGIYQIQARVACPASGKTFHIEMDGVNISGPISVPNTGGYQTFQTVTVMTPVLTVGQKVMRVVMDSPSFNLNHISFTINQPPTVSITSPTNSSVLTSGSSINISANASDADGTVAKVEYYIDGTKLGEDATSPYNIAWTSTAGVHWIKAISTDNLGTKSKGDSVTVTVRGPYGGSVWTIPGKIEAENYDIGGQGISYNDLTAGNLSNLYRTDDVDINTSNDVGGGYHIYSVQAGEWTEYSVNVTTAGTYILQVRVAATAIGKTFHIEMDGQNISGAIAIPNTGSYQTFQTVSVTTSLTAGKKIMRIVMDSPSFNLNYVSFALNQSPLVSITSPVTGTTFTSGNSVTINATASDADGSIAKVEFFVDGTKIGEDATSPYSFGWTATTGTHSLTAVGSDNSGAQTTSAAISIIVDNPNQLPNVSISSPVSGTIYKLGDAVSINATATDVDGSVAKVEFYAGTTKIGEGLTSPYNFNWTPSAGIYVITARATDDKGAVKTSSEVTITIDTPPSVSITSPVNNSGFNEADVVIITANASDSDGSIDRVEFLLDGIKIGEDATSPYVLSYTMVAGTHSLTVKAIDDLGISTTTSLISIKVNKAPLISITSPVDGTDFIEGDIVTVNVNASDVDGNIASVEFMINGVSIGTDANAPYSITWTSTKGVQTLSAIAKDNSGKTTSDTVTIYVNANQVPEVNITSPGPSTFNPGSVVSIEAEASDVDGNVTKVEFYVDGNKIGEDLIAPYSISWTTVQGTHIIKAIATDNLGAISPFSIVNINVEAPNQDPVISIVSPSSGTIFSNGDIVTINATASDPDGVVTNVQFFVDNVKIGEDATSPYSVTWSSSIEGTYTLTAQASDDKGAIAVSSNVNIIIDSPPSITISLSGGSDYTRGDNVLIEGTATDADGGILKVEFYVDGIKVGEDLTSPYSFIWTAIDGTHTITAKATDNLGIITSSSPLSISIDDATLSIVPVSGMDKTGLTIYPNPIEDVVFVRVDKDCSQTGSFVLYDQLGQEIAILVEGSINTGIYKFNLDSLGLRTGIYMIKMVTNDKIETIILSKE